MRSCDQETCPGGSACNIFLHCCPSQVTWGGLINTWNLMRATPKGDSTNGICFEQLERAGRISYLAEWVCSSDSISFEGEWFPTSADCSGAGSSRHTITWSTENFFRMKDGACAQAQYQDAPGSSSHDWGPTVWLTWSSLGLSQFITPCSYLSQAPTIAPSTAPTSAPTLPHEYLGVIIGVSALLFLGCVAGGFAWWWLRCRERLEPWEQLAREKALERCGGDREWSKECMHSESLGVAVSYLSLDQFVQEAVVAAHEAHTHPEKYRLWHPEQLEPGECYLGHTD